jgi:hypothetical protein
MESVLWSFLFLVRECSKWHCCIPAPVGMKMQLSRSSGSPLSIGCDKGRYHTQANTFAVALRNRASSIIEARPL